MLINRDEYIRLALNFRDTDLVKVVTGVRRCGKSCLFSLVQKKIENENVKNRGFITINLEEKGLKITSSNDLYNYIKSNLSNKGKTYLFIDEIQRTEGWHDVINSIRVEFNVDIYLTGSNAFLLSSELSTYLSGRYVEIKMLPLSFSEYCNFLGLKFKKDSTIATNSNARPVIFDDCFKTFLKFGGMPALARDNINQEMHKQYFSALYEAVIQRDIIGHERHASQHRISDQELLRMLCEYLADTVGNLSAVTKIANTLTSAGRKISHVTVSSYIKALVDAYIVYPCKRFDVHGKELLKTTPKNYLVDLGLISYLNNYRSQNVGFTFENAVYLQLMFKGWSVHVGKLYDKEIDFIALKDGEVMYVQVAEEMFMQSTRDRELSPLKSIKDNHKKIVVVRQGEYEHDVDGIEILKPKDFFL